MNSDFQRTLRRLKPDKQRRQLKRRDESQFHFLDFTGRTDGTLLCDTTVYVDTLQGRFPAEHEPMLVAADVWHSAVTEAELAIACSSLDPAHSATRDIIKRITHILDRRPAHRTLAPDREIWREAGILAGIIARLQRLGKTDQRRVLNDALIFCTARKFGHSVLTRNISDFDFLNQLDPSGRVLFYRI